MFLWVANFRGLTAGFSHLPTLPQTLIARYICLTKNTTVFHMRGDLSLLAIPNTRIFHFLFLLCDRETHFVSHYTEPTIKNQIQCRSTMYSRPSNTKHSVNMPCTHDIPSNTKRSVDLPCTHDIPSNTKHSVDLYHALTPMSCDVPCINTMQCH